ncbi:hypothetical protein [Streptomyces sp. ok210]|uniref:hypothetical protein n=1 Tax=Streptomyces sp. ok210 TaxID=1761905 RepID=UPI0008EA1A5E|nr:hypothetical protein [Streptomyces sp. ok210]SFT31809.1 hypothetical protein SAMN04487982_12425 [Streptomyces sp. ok210]
MTITAFPINASSGSPSYASQSFRQALAALLSPGAGGLQVQAGVRPGGGLAVSVAGSTITITAGAGVVQGGSSAVQGPYLFYSDASVTRTLTAANATNPRVDLVYARIRDTDADASGARDGDILYLAGTAAASPVAPTPADPSYIVLATISVPKSGSGSPSVSTATRAYTAAAGGVTVGSVAPTAPYTGQLWDSGDGLRRWTGTEWRYLKYDPQVSKQLANPTTYPVTATFTDFSGAQWPPLTFTVPPSGMAWISIGGAVHNQITTTSTVWVVWRASGGYTMAANAENGVAAAGGRTYATRRVLVSGMTPGASVTLTPQWYVSSVGTVGTQTFTTSGQLGVEPVA